MNEMASLAVNDSNVKLTKRYLKKIFRLLSNREDNLSNEKMKKSLEDLIATRLNKKDVEEAKVLIKKFFDGLNFVESDEEKFVDYFLNIIPAPPDFLFSWYKLLKGEDEIDNFLYYKDLLVTLKNDLYERRKNEVLQMKQIQDTNRALIAILDRRYEYKPFDQRLEGINNFGNSCYSNALLQSLFWTFGIDRLKQQNGLDSVNNSATLFGNVLINPNKSNIIKLQNACNMKINEQQDPTEMLLSLVKKNYIPRNKIELDSMVQPLLRKRRETNDIVDDIMIRIRPSTKIDEYTSKINEYGETSDDGKAYLQLLENAFTFGEAFLYTENMRKAKIYEESIVTLPEVLIINKLVYDTSGVKKRYPKNYIHYVPLRMILHTNLSKVKYYALAAFICHLGNKMNSGHYIALCNLGEGKWALMDDEKKTVVSGIKFKPNTHFLGVSNKETNRIPVLFFYKRIEEDEYEKDEASRDLFYSDLNLRF